MDLKEEIRSKAMEKGFQLFGVSDINKMEDVEFPPGRGLVKPSEFMSDAKSLVVLGMVIWDEGMNAAISTPGTGDFSEAKQNIIIILRNGGNTCMEMAQWLWMIKVSRRHPPIQCM